MDKRMRCIAYLLCLLFASQVRAESRWENALYASLDKGDTQNALAILESWKKDHGEADPQYWIAGGNVWFRIASTPTLEITAAPFKMGEDEEALILTNPETGEVAGKIGEGKPRINGKDMKKAIEFLDEAIQRFPHRLDIFTGRSHLYRTMGDLKGEVASLESMIKDPKPKDGKYETAPGRQLEGGLETYQLEMLMAYAREHVQKQDQTNDAAAKAIAALIVKSFPNRPHGYNLMGALASFDNNWSDVKKWLLLALEQAPDDSLVIANLGNCYEKLGDTKAAMDQYNKVIMLNNNPEIVKHAKEKMEKLKAQG